MSVPTTDFNQEEDALFGAPGTPEREAYEQAAASVGKSFDQLKEAVRDAKIGEFERLKEFGQRN